MSEQTTTVVDIEPALQRRAVGRNDSATQLRKAELRDIMASELLVFATATGEVIVRLMERKERLKERRFLIIMLIGIAALIGIARYMMQVVQT